MTVALYVTSTETYSGKSALCIGLMRRLRKDGFKVGYFKPVSFTPRQEEEGAVVQNRHR